MSRKMTKDVRRVLDIGVRERKKRSGQEVKWRMGCERRNKVGRFLITMEYKKKPIFFVRLKSVKAVGELQYESMFKTVVMTTKKKSPSLSQHAFEEPKYAFALCLGVLVIMKLQNPSIKGVNHNNRFCSPLSSCLKPHPCYSIQWPIQNQSKSV